MPSFKFKGQPFVYSHHLSVPVCSLMPEASLSFHADRGNNLLIAGDNLLGLKALIPRYAGSVQCVLGAPPYNNGVVPWKYTDAVPGPLMAEWRAAKPPVAKDDPERHDKWLCMMWPRLRLMHQLLEDKGVLLLHCDDTELFHLQLILNDIFQPDNHLLTFVWEKRYNPSPDSKDRAYTHECILAYRKTPAFRWFPRPMTRKELSRFCHVDEQRKDKFRPADYTCKYSREQRPNLYYPIEHPAGNREPVYPDPARVWAGDPSWHAKNVAENRVWWGVNGDNATPSRKRYLSEAREKQRLPPSLLRHDLVGHTDGAAKELKELVGEKVKYHTKPVKLLQYLLTVATKPGALVLDPFGGSGEVGHAVLLMNRKNRDRPERRFVVIQPDEGVARKLTVQRLRQAVKGVPGAKKEWIAEGTGGGFEFCTLGPAIDSNSMLDGSDLPSYEAVARAAFYAATGRPLDSVPPVHSTGFIGESPTIRVHLIYRPDADWLKSTDAALDRNRAEAIAVGSSNKRCAVFAAARFVSVDELLGMNLEYCPMPFALTREGEG